MPGFGTNRKPHLNVITRLKFGNSGGKKNTEKEDTEVKLLKGTGKGSIYYFRAPDSAYQRGIIRNFPKDFPNPKT